MVANLQALCYNEYITISKQAKLLQDNQLIGLKVMTNARLIDTADFWQVQGL
jgi:hypothetical protein